MTKRYDNTGRHLLACDWSAIRNIPLLVEQLGAAADPGSGTWLVEYDGDTDTFTFTTSGVLTVDASQVTYTSTGSQWAATHVDGALHDLEAAVDVLQADTGLSQGSFTCTWPSGFSVAPANTTIFFSKLGPFVCLTVHTSTLGTGTGTAGFTLGSLPADLTPAHEKAVMAQGVIGGTASVGTAKIKTNNTIEFAFLIRDAATDLIFQTGSPSSSSVGLNSLASIMYTTD